MPRPGGDDNGAALVEFALVATLLTTLVFGTFEIGMAWRDAQMVTQSTRAAARTATQLGIHPDADRAAIDAVEAGLGDLRGDLDRIVIYRASTSDGAVPSACLTVGPPGVPGICSVYTASAFDTFSPGAWLPTVRNNTDSSADYVGVYVAIERQLLTGLLDRDTFLIADRAVMRMEPNAGNP